MSIITKSFTEGYDYLAKLLSQSILELEQKHREEPLDLTGTLGGMFASLVDLIGETNLLYKKASGKEAVRINNLLGFFLTDIVSNPGWNFSQQTKDEIAKLITHLYKDTELDPLVKTKSNTSLN
jgi:aspartokinase-like uncharacterized kinase